MDFVDDHEFAAFVESELVFGVHQNQPAFFGEVGPGFEEGCGELLGLCVEFLAHDPARDDFGPGGDCVVGAHLGLGGWGEQGLR